MWQLEPKMSVRQINNWTSNGGEGTRYFSHATWTSDYREPEVVQLTIAETRLRPRPNPEVFRLFLSER